MKTVKQIYNEYKIMPTLALHQLRVASVAKMICHNLKKGEVDADNVVLACLFHDMGNIIKSNFSHFPDFLEPEGLPYWQAIKDEYLKKYGPDEHQATEMIAKEINLSSKAVELIEKFRFSSLSEIEKSGSMENKICSYADMRVGPYGVISIEERFEDGQRRYGKKFHSIISNGFEVLSGALRDIEKQIFSLADLKPEDINDKKIERSIESLRSLLI